MQADGRGVEPSRRGDVKPFGQRQGIGGKGAGIGVFRAEADVVGVAGQQGAVGEDEALRR